MHMKLRTVDCAPKTNKYNIHVSAAMNNMWQTLTSCLGYCIIFYRCMISDAATNVLELTVGL